MASSPEKNQKKQHLTKTSNDSCSEGKVHLTDLKLDSVELSLLRASRFIALSYAAPQSQAWELAFDYLDETFNPENGPVIAYTLTNIMRAMRRARKTNFLFNNPVCPRCCNEITSCEKYLIQTIKAVRRKEMMIAGAQAMMLCEGNDHNDFLNSCKRLATLVPKHERKFFKKRMRFV